MKSYELQAELNAYLSKLDSKIAEYKSILQSVKSVSTSMNSFDGLNTKFYTGITSNINSVSSSIGNNISTLESLKGAVTSSVVPRIRELKIQEDAEEERKRRKRLENMEKKLERE